MNSIKSSLKSHRRPHSVEKKSPKLNPRKHLHTDLRDLAISEAIVFFFPSLSFHLSFPFRLT